MRVVSADPGFGGALAIVERPGIGLPFVVIAALDMPTLPDGKKKQIDIIAISRWYSKSGGADRAVVENVQPMPSQSFGGEERRSMGSGSAFRFGMACGEVRGFFKAMGLRPVLVHPTAWKPYFGLSGGNKDASLAKALERLPDAAALLTLKKHEARAEAMLMAVYAIEEQVFDGV